MTRVVDPPLVTVAPFENRIPDARGRVQLIGPAAIWKVSDVVDKVGEHNVLPIKISIPDDRGPCCCWNRLRPNGVQALLIFDGAAATRERKHSTAPKAKAPGHS